MKREKGKAYASSSAVEEIWKIIKIYLGSQLKDHWDIQRYLELTQAFMNTDQKYWDLDHMLG